MEPCPESALDAILHAISTHSTVRLSSPAADSNSKASFSTAATAGAPNALSHLSPAASTAVKQLLVTLHFFFPHELLPALDLLDRGLLKWLVLRGSDSTDREEHVTTRARSISMAGGLSRSDPSTSLNSRAQVDFKGGGRVETQLQPESELYTPSKSQPQPQPAAEAEAKVPVEVFYVQSASASAGLDPLSSSRRHARGGSVGGGGGGGRFHNVLSATNTHYEVRLDSWNCSCAAFAFASLQQMFKSVSMSAAEDVRRDGNGRGYSLRNWSQNGRPRRGKAALEELVNAEIGTGMTENGRRDWSFGGTATMRADSGVGIPVCKHILGALLVKVAPALYGSGGRGDGHGLKREEVSREEMAGWVAGWGDCG